MNYSLSPPNDGVGVLRARCRLVSSKGRDCLLPSKDGIGPLRMPQAPPNIFFRQNNLAVTVHPYFSRKNNPFFVKNLCKSV